MLEGKLTNSFSLAEDAQLPELEGERPQVIGIGSDLLVGSRREDIASIGVRSSGSLMPMR